MTDTSLILDLCSIGLVLFYIGYLATQSDDGRNSLLNDLREIVYLPMKEFIFPAEKSVARF